MKKFILALAATAMCASAFSQNKCYTYEMADEDGYKFPVYGALHRVSPNGLWATGGDEGDETGCFIINTSDPSNLIFNDGGFLLDIDNNGMAVGCWYEKIGYAKYKRAAIFVDGQWKQLPLPEEILGQSQAVAISADSKTIAGHGMCANEAPDEPGRYFPMIWKLNEASGEYELFKLYNNLWLPGTFGFFVYDMTPDAKYVCGIQCLDMGDTVTALLNLETGEYNTFHNIEVRNHYFEEFQDYYPQMFIDNIMDGFDEFSRFNGMFYYATNEYLFGSRGVASDVQEDGTGVITNYAAVYDLNTGEFTLGPKNQIYICGVDPNQTFNNYGELTIDGTAKSVESIVATGDIINGIYSYDDSGKIWSGSYLTFTSLGDMIESPVLVILEEPGINGLQQALADISAKPLISVADRTISVDGAKSVEIFNMTGSLVSKGAKAQVAPGVYVVKADAVSYKIIVR